MVRMCFFTTGMIVAPKYTDYKVIKKLVIEKVISGGPAETHGNI